LVAGPAVGVLQAGNHGSTFGGNPLVCRTALAVIDTIEDDHLIDNVNKLSAQMLAGFKAKLNGVEGVKAIRSAGFMFGIELVVPCADLVKQALDKGILINVTAEKVIRLLPPMVINIDEANKIVIMVSDLVIDFLSSQAIESVA